ncbi:MAG: DNA repair protein RecO [Chloroflexota bacterium]|nr:MAG: DNA repair protein RecO [Chloroflexota bacterium]
MARTERAFRTDAIILKRRDFNEADRLLTVFTPKHGKIDVIAKGARKPTSTKAGHVELFTRVDMLIHRGRDFGILSQAEMVEPFLALRDDLQRGAYASYAAELVDRFTGSEDEDQRHLYNLLDSTLQRLCEEDDLRLVIRYFEIHLLGLAGFQPELNECVIGREPVMPEDQYFSYVEGGVICVRHAVRTGQLIDLPMVTLKLLRHMQRSPFSKVRSLKVASNLHEDAERILLGYITFLLERRLESVDFIRRLRQET